MADRCTVDQAVTALAVCAVENGWLACAGDKAAGTGNALRPPRLLAERDGTVLVLHVTSSDAARKPMAAGPDRWAKSLAALGAEVLWVTPETLNKGLTRLMENP